MSHITLLQYVTQLQNLGLTQPQINAAVQEWQKTHTPAETQELSESIEQVKVTSEGKTSDVGTQGASPTSTTELVPESSPSLDGLSESQSPVIKNIIARNKAKKKYEENIKQVDFLIEDLNKTGDFSKIYAFNEENPGSVNIDAIIEFEKKYYDD